MSLAEIKIGCVANLWSRQMFFKRKGDIEPGHLHNFDHLTLLSRGSLAVTVNGETTNFEEGTMIYIKADLIHELVALEDNTLAYCIHALRDGERVEDIIDPESVPKGIDPFSSTIVKKITHV